MAIFTDEFWGKLPSLSRVPAALAQALAWVAKPVLGAVLGAAIVLAGQQGCLPLPGPLPPNPPGPVPPGPVDPFAAAVKLAYTAETDPKKAEQIALLAALYRQSGPTCQRQDLKTVGELYSALKEAANRLIPAEALPKVRRAIADELNKLLPTDPAAPIDQPTRDLAAKKFAIVATILEALPKS